MCIRDRINSTRECQLELQSRFGPFSINIIADVAPEDSFGYRIDRLRIGAVVSKLKLMTLADPAFSKPVIDIPAVNIIVGAEHYKKILGSKSKSKNVDGVDLYLSNFGWVVIGKLPSSE